MTLPEQSDRAVAQTREFLVRLASPYLENGIKGIRREVRAEALALLRHYPYVWLSQKCDCPAPDNAARQDKVGRTLARRLVSRLRVLGDDSRKVYGLHAADCAAAMDEAASHIELLEAAYKSSGSALAVIDGGFKNAVAEVARLRLTDEERAAVAWCVEMAATTATECDEELAALRGLLERLT
jgi:hypothetical protein